ncbi:hypothetical protein V6N13_107670 [Hibiscus sabdariffa]
MEKAEGSSIAENRFDRVSNAIVDALKDHEEIIELGGVGKILSLLMLKPRCFIVVVFQAVVEIVLYLACDHFSVAAKVTFQSDQAYVNNVFRAKIMPYTNDRSLITCAKDGEVWHARSLELKLDGVVKQSALRRTTAATTLFMCQPTYNRRVNGLAFSDQSELLVSYSEISAHNESSGKAIPQVYRGPANYEKAKSVSFFGPKSE